MDLNPIHYPSPVKIENAHFWITTSDSTSDDFWITTSDDPGLVDGLKPLLPPLCSQKYKMLIFGLRSTSDDRTGWSMDLNPIHYPSPVKKIKCSFLDYVQLLMIGQSGQWTQTPSATPLQRKKWNAHFWTMFNFWWLAGLVDGLKPHLPPLSNQKKKCSFLDFIQLLMISRAGRCTRTPSATPLQPKK